MKCVCMSVGDVVKLSPTQQVGLSRRRWNIDVYLLMGFIIIIIFTFTLTSSKDEQ